MSLLFDSYSLKGSYLSQKCLLLDRALFSRTQVCLEIFCQKSVLYRLVIVVASLLTVVGGFSEFGYNLGNLGRICINIRGNDPLGAEWRDARATLR